MLAIVTVSNAGALRSLGFGGRASTSPGLSSARLFMSVAPPDITKRDDGVRESKRARVRKLLKKIPSFTSDQGTSTEKLAPQTETPTLINQPAAAAAAMLDSEPATKQEERETIQQGYKTTEEERETTEEYVETIQQGYKTTDEERETTEEYVAVTMESLQSKEPATIALGLVFGYVGMGVGFYSSVTGWSPLEALYFVVVTLTSVGYGDLVPTGDDVRLFTALYILLGVGILGTALGEVVSSLLNVDATPAGRVIKWLSGAGQSTQEGGGEGGDAKPGVESQSEMDQLMGGESAQETLIKTLTSVGACLALGSVAFYWLEPGITPVQAFYNAVVTSTTVGYGDLTPTTPQAQAFVCAYALFGTILLARSLGALANIPLERRRIYQQQLVLDQYGGELDAEELDDLQATLTELELCDADRGYCTRSDFALAMLVRQDKVTRGDVQAALGTFAKLDIDGSGELDDDDVQAWLDKQREEKEEA